MASFITTARQMTEMFVAKIS